MGTKAPSAAEGKELLDGLRHWHSINDGRLQRWSEELVKKAMIHELANNCRPDIVHRLYGRYGKIRKHREMKDLMSGS